MSALCVEEDRQQEEKTRGRRAGRASTGARQQPAGNYIKDITCRQGSKRGGKPFGVYTVDLIHHEHVAFILGDDTHPSFSAEFEEAGYGNQRKPLPRTLDLIGKKNSSWGSSAQWNYTPEGVLASSP